MRSVLPIALLGALLGACAAPQGADKEAHESVKEVSLADSIKTLVEADNADGLKALIQAHTLVICDLALRDSEMKACTVLELACSSGAVECVRYLLDDLRINPNYLGREGICPLTRAAPNNNIKIIKLLLDHHADIEMKDVLNESQPIHWAAYSGAAEVIKMLAKEGADLNLQVIYGGTPLTLAIGCDQLSSVAALLDAGADKNLLDGSGNTPLYTAIWCGAKNIAALLLDKGADVNLPAKNGDTPLHLASSAGTFDFVQYLLSRGADPALRNQDGKTAENVARFKADSTVSAQIFNSPEALNKCKQDYNLVVAAVEGDRDEELKELLTQNTLAYWDQLFYEFRQSFAINTVLNFSLQKRATKCATYLLNQRQYPIEWNSEEDSYCSFVAATRDLTPADAPCVDHLLELLLSKGAAIDAQDSDGFTAVSRVNAEAVQLLLSRKADPNRVTKTGFSPLFSAIWDGASDVVSVLLADSRTDKDLANVAGQYPVYLAVLRNDLKNLQALLKGDKPAKTYQEPKDPAYPKRIPLITAVRFSSYDCVKLLLDAGADRSIQDEAGKTALDYAREIPGNSRLVKLLEGSST